MRRTIQLFMATLIASIACAQVCPDIPNNTTDPNNPQDHRGNDPTQNDYINKDINDPTQPKLDWMVVPYSYHLNATTICPDVYNPFFADDNNPNIKHL